MALPLQVRGRARVLYSGNPRQQPADDDIRIDLGEGLSAVITVSEPMLPDGRSGSVIPDDTIAAKATGGVDPAMDKAIALARNARPSSTDRKPVCAMAPVVRDRSYAAMHYPSLEYRLLAAMRLWNVIDLFYPYHDLLDRRWDGVLTEMIPLFERARDAKEYAEAVATMSTRIQDSHAYVAGDAFTEAVVRTGLPPIRIRMIQDSLLVTAIYDSTAAQTAGIAVGDVLLSADGVKAIDLYRRVSDQISASTPQGGREKWTLQLLNGKPGTLANLTLRDRNGRLKRAVIPRRHEDYTTLYHRERKGPIVRMLTGNVGYVDLDRLDFSMIDSMFSQLKNTRAIVFDMRGYPNGTIYTLAPHFTERSRVVSLLGTPMIGHGSPADRSIETFAQTVVPGPPAQRYRGKTLMLIDERAVSQAEHTGMWMKVLNGTLFVGSPTAGANGEITTVSLPGGMTVGFTGQSVVFPDGRQVQRKGLQPDIPAEPTIAGIRAGKDEVLDAALRYLSKH